MGSLKRFEAQQLPVGRQVVVGAPDVSGDDVVEEVLYVVGSRLPR